MPEFDPRTGEINLRPGDYEVLADTTEVTPYDRWQAPRERVQRAGSRVLRGAYQTGRFLGNTGLGALTAAGGYFAMPTFVRAFVGHMREMHEGPEDEVRHYGRAAGFIATAPIAAVVVPGLIGAAVFYGEPEWALPAMLWGNTASAMFETARAAVPAVRARLARRRAATINNLTTT